MKVIGVDAGYVNMGYAVLHLDGMEVDRTRSTIERVTLLRKKHVSHDDMRKAVVKFVGERAADFEAAEVIALERQKKALFQIFNTVLWTLFSDKVVFVHPLNMSKVWGLSKIRDQKKQDTIKLARRFVDVPRGKGKIDDACDAAILALTGVIRKKKWEVDQLLKFVKEADERSENTAGKRRRVE